MYVRVVVMALCSGTGMKRSDVCTGGGHGRTSQTETSNSFPGLPMWSFPSTSTKQVQQASSHAFTVNNFHNRQLSHI